MPKRRKARNNALRGAVLDGQRDMLIQTARTRRSTTIRELVDLADELGIGDITVAELQDGPRARPAPRSLAKPTTRKQEARNNKAAKRGGKKVKSRGRKSRGAKDLRGKGARVQYDANVLRALVTSSEPMSGPELLAKAGGTAIALRASIARLEAAGKAKSWGERRAKRYASKRVAARVKKNEA